MRQPSSLFILALFCLLAFIAGCNPPTNPTCSTTYIGKAVINEVSKVTGATTDDANDFVEIKIIDSSLTTATLNNWNVLICEKGASQCRGGALSSATVTTATDGSGARYYVLKGTTDIGSQINFSVGTEIALSDQNDYAIDYLSIGGYADHKPTSCTFSYDIDATSNANVRRIRRNADGSGNWETINLNEQPATEGLHNTAMPPVSAEWRMDETSWSAAANEVVATSGSLNGSGRNGANTSNTTPSPARGGNPGTCRYGEADGVDDYVTIANGTAANYTSAMTFSAWIYPEAAGSSGQGTVLAKGIVSNSGTPDFSYALRLNNTNLVNFYWCTTSSCSSPNVLTGGNSSTNLLNTWTHVAVVFHSGYQKIYFNGVEVGASSTAGTLTANTRPLFFGSTPTSATNPNSFFYQYDGMVDEVRFYRAALTQAQVQTVRDETHGCSGPATVHHFDISTDGAGVTCESESVTITAHDSSHNPVTGYNGTITIGTNTNKGNWSLSSGSGTLNNGSADDGAATYAFPSSQSAVTLLLSHFTTADVNINVADGTLIEGANAEDDHIVFSNSGLVFLSRDQSTLAETSTLPAQIAGKSSATGWNRSDLILRAVQTNQTTHKCAPLLTTTARPVTVSYQCITPNTCASDDALSLAGNAVPDNPASAVTSTRNINLAFDTQASVLVPIVFSDAGNIRVNAATTVTDSAGTTLQLTGSTSVNVRPFGIRYSTVVSGTTNNPQGTATSASNTRFVTAGSPLSTTLNAIAYDGSDAMDGNGFPAASAVLTNNSITPNFIFPNMPLTIASFTPVAGVAGTLSTSSVNFSGGSATLSNFTYSDVGSFVLRASTPSYLGSVALQGDTPTIGRFYPARFDLQSVTQTWSCKDDLLLYMNEPITFSMQLRALNVQGNVTSNYDAAATYPVATVLGVAENANAGSNLAARMALPAGVWSKGLYVNTAGSTTPLAGTLTYTRAVSPDSPYDKFQYGLRVTDGDGAALDNLDMDVSTSNTVTPGGVESCTASTCKERKIGAELKVRYGRLALRDTTGSDRATAIVIPGLIEYYNGSQFVRNEADSCTNYGSSQINDVNFSGALASSYTDARATTAGRWWLPTSDQKMSAGLFRNHPNGLFITPVAGQTGRLGITLNTFAPPASATIPAWLRYKWDGTNETGPSCTVTLGQSRGHDRVIFWRELH